RSSEGVAPTAAPNSPTDATCATQVEQQQAPRNAQPATTGPSPPDARSNRPRRSRIARATVLATARPTPRPSRPMTSVGQSDADSTPCGAVTITVGRRYGFAIWSGCDATYVWIPRESSGEEAG